MALTYQFQGASARVALLACAITCIAGNSQQALGQAGVAFTQQQPFVIGLIPVVGRGGAVGGVSIDAQGVVARSDVDRAQRLREARLRALAEIDSRLEAASPLRKISLRDLTAAIEQRMKAGLPATDEIQNLAGLTRIQYVLVYPERGDIVLAGPAEGWQVNDLGCVVGVKSGQPVLQLDDLIVALRTAKEQPKTGELITCSIDPTAEGLTRFTRMLNSRDLPINDATVAGLEQAVGPQQVTLTGVPPGTHFAQVLVAADFLMKRLAMNFEPAPIDGLPSYMEMLQADRGPAPRNAMPRWWMTASYEPLLKDEAGLAWQLRGPGVQTLSEDGILGRGGKAVAREAKGNSLAKKWADTMTASYDALADKLPVFAELRNCMDLAVVGALLVKEDLPGRAGCDLSLLLEDKRVAVAEYHVPKTIDSRAS
ncbi:MAG TPA: DUF1598 domain-containing protein, partial [Pirellulaceae bacterium]|nr:DUF1598 domain-containing protein [Pirellulaceae bacterium]